MAKYTMNDIMRKLDDIDQSIEQMQHDLLHMAKDMDKQTPKPNPSRKAKDVPIGTSVRYCGINYTVIGHGLVSDLVLVLEDEDGDITTENVDDVFMGKEA